MNTLIIAEVVLIIKGDATVQLRISAVLLRKPGRWAVPYAGKFDSVETMQLYVAGFGILAPVILVFIQAMQVILPVLPGFFGCIVGTALFGWKEGFWLNYIGISAGSIIAFLLAKKYGQPLVRKLFPGEKYKKISNWATSS